MLWSSILIIMFIEILLGFVCGRMLIPYFRKLKTGKLELYIGDRFKKDGSEPLFGGIIIALPLIMGTFLCLGMVNRDIGSESVSRYIAVIAYSLAFMAVGVAEDYLKDVKKANTGIKISTKLVLEYIICLGFLLSLKSFCGVNVTQVLFPFRLGYVDFGVMYYPLMALGMLVTVNAVKIHDCFGADTKSGSDGLCVVSVIICSLFFAVYENIVADSWLGGFGYVFASAVGGVLVWSISPSKIYPGQSGGFLLGGMISGLAVASGLHLLVLMAGVSFFVDGACSVIQYIVYRKNKKLIFKGNSLHAHFKAKGYSDYKIMIIFSIISIAGGLAGAAFAFYSTKIV